jgi:hypothetical protein
MLPPSSGALEAGGERVRDGRVRGQQCLVRLVAGAEKIASPSAPRTTDLL